MSSPVSWFSAPTNRQPTMPSAPTNRARDPLGPLDIIEHMAQGLTEQLSVASAARWSRRVRVTVIPLTLGIASGLAGVLLFLGSDDLSTRANVARCLIMACPPITLLSAPANDARAAVGAAVIFMCLMALALVAALNTARYINAAIDATPVCGMRYQLEVRLHVYLLFAVTDLCAIAVLLSRLAQHSVSRCAACAPLGWLRPITTRQLTHSLWRTTGCTYMLNWCAWVFYIWTFGNIQPAFDSTTLFAELLSQQFLMFLFAIFCLR
jgi:hypothetical protein